MADVKIPGVGTVPKKGAVAGLGVLALVLGIAWYRHSKNASAAAASTSAQPDPNAIDPATGLTYGEEAAGIQAGDLAGGGTGYGDTSGIVGYSANGQPVYADQVGYGPTPNFVNNAAWSQAAQQYLVASTGADAGTVAAALGTYLAGQPLTQAQASVVQQAIAFFGQPPQAGSNGYPPSLNLSGASGTSGGSTGTGGAGDSGTGGTSPAGTGSAGTGSSTPPASTGGGSASAGAISNLQAYNVTKSSFNVRWNAAQGATQGYEIIVSQLNGAIVKRVPRQSGTSLAVTNLHPGWTYNVGVQALPGGAGDNIHVSLPSK
jgi:Fibronectin type III domain